MLDLRDLHARWPLPWRSPQARCEPPRRPHRCPRDPQGHRPHQHPWHFALRLVSHPRAKRWAVQGLRVMHRCYDRYDTISSMRIALISNRTFENHSPSCALGVIDRIGALCFDAAPKTNEHCPPLNFVSRCLVVRGGYCAVARSTL